MHQNEKKLKHFKSKHDFNKYQGVIYLKVFTIKNNKYWVETEYSKLSMNVSDSLVQSDTFVSSFYE